RPRLFLPDSAQHSGSPLAQGADGARRLKSQDFMETSSQPAHGAAPPATPESADHLAIRAGEWRTVFYSFAVLNLVTIAVSFWFMVRVAELDDPLVHAASRPKFEYSISSLCLRVRG